MLPPRSGLLSLHGWIRLALFAVVALGCQLVTVREAHAYAWLIKHRYGGCATCHADPSGGELLTPYGRLQGELLLQMPYGDKSRSAAGSHADSGSSSSGFDSFDSFDSLEGEGEGDAASSAATTEAPASEAASDDDSGPQLDTGLGRGAFLWGIDLPEALLLGGSYRLFSLVKDGEVRVFPMMADLYGQLALGSFRVAGSVGVAKVPAGSPHARPAQLTTNQRDGLNVISRTHWVGYDWDSGKYMLRAGRLNLPFGLRTSEHVAWVRESSRTDRESDQQHGVALAFNSDSLRAEMMAVLGNYQINPDKFRERGYVGFVEGMLDEQNAVGISSLWTTAGEDRFALEQAAHVRTANGVFWRFTLMDPLVLMGELDMLTNTRRDIGYTGLMQADYELTQGLHLIGTGEVVDRGLKSQPPPGGATQKALVIPGEGKAQTGFWLSAQWFFFSHLDFRADLVMRHGEPTQIWGQLHLYL